LDDSSFAYIAPFSLDFLHYIQLQQHLQNLSKHTKPKALLCLFITNDWQQLQQNIDVMVVDTKENCRVPL
jgi:hypothetical protein